jgi:hypothetical protein
VKKRDYKTLAKLDRKVIRQQSETIRELSTVSRSDDVELSVNLIHSPLSINVKWLDEMNNVHIENIRLFVDTTGNKQKEFNVEIDNQIVYFATHSTRAISGFKPSDDGQQE